MIYKMFTRILSTQTQANSVLRFHGSIQIWKRILCEAYAEISTRRGELCKWKNFFLKKKSCHDKFSLTKPKGEKNWRARKHHACNSAWYRTLDADQQNAWFTTTRQSNGLWSKFKYYIFIPLFLWPLITLSDSTQGVHMYVRILHPS